MEIFGHEPGFRDRAATLTVHDVEHVLADWFEAEVILTSSGRAALLLYLEALGLDRYRDRIVLPRLISACVLEAVIRRGFPVDAATGEKGDVSILYHQYGIPQQERPPGIVIEDICHGFFAGTSKGAREWRGEIAIFSLPKFFGLNGMAGGLVILRNSRSDQLRQMLHAARNAAPLADGRRRFRPGQNNLSRGEIEAFYLGRLLNPVLQDDETGGLPGSISEIRSIGDRRYANLERLMVAAGKTAFPGEWLEMLPNALPFALPVFGEPKKLQRIVVDLSEIGVRSGQYHIDVAREMSNPRHLPAVLVPCHHELPASKLDQMAAILRAVSPRLVS